MKQGVKLAYSHSTAGLGFIGKKIGGKCAQL